MRDNKYMLNLKVKSGLGGWVSDDSIDYRITRITSPIIPRMGETITVYIDKLNGDTGKYVKFLINDINYVITDTDILYDVYVVPLEPFRYR